MSRQNANAASRKRPDSSAPDVLEAAGFLPVTSKLPAPHEAVEVTGEYVPPGTGYPKAALRPVAGEMQWSSTEWRGMVAITHWRPL